MTFQFTSLPVSSFLDQAIKTNAAYANQHGVRLRCTSSISNHQIYADPDRLMQVLNNLISNAVKFSASGSTVELAERLHNDRICISVTDHGNGIPEDFQTKLFDKFTQSDASDTRKIGGTGLGLSITKAIIEKHNGYIHFRSDAGVGTTFTCEFPTLLDPLDSPNPITESAMEAVPTPVSAKLNTTISD